jgi:hypothetical protein
MSKLIALALLADTALVIALVVLVSRETESASPDRIVPSASQPDEASPPAGDDSPPTSGATPGNRRRSPGPPSADLQLDAQRVAHLDDFESRVVEQLALDEREAAGLAAILDRLRDRRVAGDDYADSLRDASADLKVLLGVERFGRLRQLRREWLREWREGNAND